MSLVGFKDSLENLLDVRRETFPQRAHACLQELAWTLDKASYRLLFAAVYWNNARVLYKRFYECPHSPEKFENNNLAISSLWCLFNNLIDSFDCSFKTIYARSASDLLDIRPTNFREVFGKILLFSGHCEYHTVEDFLVFLIHRKYLHKGLDIVNDKIGIIVANVFESFRCDWGQLGLLQLLHEKGEYCFCNIQITFINLWTTRQHNYYWTLNASVWGV